HQLQLVVRAGERRFRNLEGARDHGLTIGTLEGSVAVKVLKKAGVQAKPYPDQDGPYRNLCRGQDVQGVLMDLPIALYYAAPDPHLKYSRQHDFRGLEFAGPPFAEGYYAIAVH